ncbi:MAG: 2Fe-2S iron-sulfur cluster-binding protein [Myxococcales bacterium]|nr:2Fe-2S iron-sulfur cluster-binding protein [Myxococcales bacterium]
MALIRFEPSGFETTIALGARIVDVTDEFPDAEIPYSCRSASCGSCRVEVVEGADAMAPAETDELEVLEAVDEGEGIRLACQLRLVGECERIVLRICDPLW